MWRILKQKKNQVIPKEADYVFEKLSDFEKLVPYLYPKIDGEWSIIFLGFSLKDLLYCEEKLDIPEYVNIVAYVSKDVHDRFLARYPKYVEKEVSNHERYKEVLKSIPRIMTAKAIRELYSRFHGNIERIEEALEEIIKNNPDKETIDIKDVDSVVVESETVYAKELLYAFLIYDNELIERRGNPLSGYRWKRPWELYEKIVRSLGRDFAFYAIRKQVEYLIDEKIKYMHNEDYKEQIVEYLDTDMLAELYGSFHIYGPASLSVLLRNIGRRKRDDSLFKGKVFTVNQ